MHLNNLTFSYRNKKIFNNFQMRLVKGSINILKGQNGAGKTTLLKIIAELIPINKSFYKKEETFSYCPDYLNLPNHLTSLEFFCLLGNNYYSFMTRFNLPNTRIGKMSKGMKQKVVLIAALMKKAELYIFDEVDANLDKNSIEIIKEIFTEMKKMEKTIIMSSHHYELFEAIADYTWQLN